MSNKNLVILFSIGLLLIGGLFYFWFSSQKTSNTSSNTVQPNEPYINPFGSKSTDNTPNGTSSQSNVSGQSNIIGGSAPKLTQIYKNPTSGFLFTINKSKQDNLMFVDRATGNIYEYVPESQTNEANRVTNTTIPKIQESVWGSNGENLVYRYLDNDTDNIVSFAGKINRLSPNSDNPGGVVGSFLAQNIKQLVVNPSGDKLFNLVDKSDKSGTYGYTTNLDGTSKKAVFESPISYWNVSWPKDSIITFTTKPSYRDYGLLYFFNTKTLSMDRILGNLTGLSTVTNKDASLVAYSSNINNSFSLNVYDTVKKLYKNIKISTLADKCVWGNVNSKVLYCAIPQLIFPDNYPDAWYMGTRSFSDDIWMVDTELGTAKELYVVGSNENASIDVYDIKISQDDKYLSFSNKSDLSLWLLDLKQD